VSPNCRRSFDLTKRSHPHRITTQRRHWNLYIDEHTSWITALEVRIDRITTVGGQSTTSTDDRPTLVQTSHSPIPTGCFFLITHVDNDSQLRGRMVLVLAHEGGLIGALVWTGT